MTGMMALQAYQKLSSSFADFRENEMESLFVQFKGHTTELALPQGDSTTVAQLKELLEVEFGVPSDAQRVFFNKKRIEFDSIDNRSVQELGLETKDTPSRIFLMAGATKGTIEGMKKTQEEVEAEQRIRATRRVVSIGRKNEQMQAKEAVSTDYRFHAIEVLENFPDAHRARSILEQLANDRGILAVMAKHKWSVGCLAEMYPEGKVGVDPVCVLGLNQNKGQKILLRLRTDDLQGFRKILNIKKVLFHELSHNVHSDHDNQFYQLMRTVERECNELDWSNHGGHTVGGEGSVAVIPDRDESTSARGQRLGGGSHSMSRLLRDPPAETVLSHTIHEVVVDEKSAIHSEPALESPTVVDEGTLEAMEVDTAPAVVEIHEPMVVDEQESSTIIDANNPPQEETSTTPAPLFDDTTSFGDYQPSERELRMQRALEDLYTRYAADSVSNAASLLHKILSNLVEHANDNKYRSIRKSNRLFQTRLASYPECFAFLEAVGFEDQGESMVFVRNDPALLWLGRSSLEILQSRIENHRI